MPHNALMGMCGKGKDEAWRVYGQHQPERPLCAGAVSGSGQNRPALLNAKELSGGQQRKGRGVGQAEAGPPVPRAGLQC